MLGCHIYVSASPITATPSAENFFRSCIGIPLIVVLYFGYKIAYGTRIVRSVSISQLGLHSYFSFTNEQMIACDESVGRQDFRG